MNVTLIDITTNPETKIAEAAGICYDAETNPLKNIRRIQTLIRNKHYAALRFANATFKISGISRACSHQLVRTAHAGFLQRSQRYTHDVSAVVIPPSFAALPVDLLITIRDHISASHALYQTLLDNGIRKEDARFVLPEGTETELMMTGNFQMWLGWLKLRTDICAQWEIRELAFEIQTQLAEHAPNIFGGYNATTS